jgi:DNA-binding FadR family transcriptional regulator
VLDAIAARDPEAAYEAMRALVDKSGADLDRLR